MGTTAEIMGHMGTQWRHVDCWSVPKKLQSVDEIDGFGDLNAADQALIRDRVAQRYQVPRASKKKKDDGTGAAAAPAAPASAAVAAPKPAAASKVPTKAVSAPVTKPKSTSSSSAAAVAAVTGSTGGTASTAGSFFKFQRLCFVIGEVPAHLEKTKLLSTFLQKEYPGDAYPLFKLLLPKSENRVYHVQDKTLIKIMAGLLDCSPDSLERAFETGPSAGNIADVCRDVRIP
jgi:hypothetical protein